MKTCTQCLKSKELILFSRQSSTIDGRRSKCKVCLSTERIAYVRTKEGLVSRIYGTQRGSSKTRKHPMPTYSKEELKKWLYNQELFHELYDKWVESDYNRFLVPSCDRHDDFKGYSFSNIELKTWRENGDKGHKDSKFGDGTRGMLCKAVSQYDLNGNFIQEFFSCSEAARHIGLHYSGISKCCNSRLDIVGGYRWKYNKDIL